MTDEKRLIDGHVLDGEDPLARLQFNHTVNKQKRVPMRKKLLDRRIFHRIETDLFL